MVLERPSSWPAKWFTVKRSWRRGQVVRQGSAKALYMGSNPIVASQKKRVDCPLFDSWVSPPRGLRHPIAASQKKRVDCPLFDSWVSPPRGLRHPIAASQKKRVDCPLFDSWVSPPRGLRHPIAASQKKRGSDLLSFGHLCLNSGFSCDFPNFRHRWESNSCSSSERTDNSSQIARTCAGKIWSISDFPVSVM